MGLIPKLMTCFSLIFVDWVTIRAAVITLFQLQGHRTFLILPGLGPATLETWRDIIISGGKILIVWFNCFLIGKSSKIKFYYSTVLMIFIRIFLSRFDKHFMAWCTAFYSISTVCFIAAFFNCWNGRNFQLNNFVEFLYLLRTQLQFNLFYTCSLQNGWFLLAPLTYFIICGIYLNNLW